MDELDQLPLPLIKKGKVRSVYQFSENTNLIVTSDRISAFDHVLPTQIPGKGRILNELSVAWFSWIFRTNGAGLRDRIHLVQPLLDTYILYAHRSEPVKLQKLVEQFPDLQNRWMLVRAATPIPVEWVVRKYLVGSAWKSYQETKTAFGIPLSGGLAYGNRLPQPILTPTTKAAPGIHDEPKSETEIEQEIGPDLFLWCKLAAVNLFKEATRACEAAGVIVVDTKFEFGLDSNGSPMLIDEIFTPDSSRFWLAEDYGKGTHDFYDKEYLRQALRNDLHWSGDGPAPELPGAIASETYRRYWEVSSRILSIL